MLIGLILLFVVSISAIVRLYTDLLWYQEVGFSSVFWTTVGAKVLLAIAFGLAFFVFALINLLIVTRMTPVYRVAVDPEDPFERYRGSILPYMRWASLGIAAVLGFFFGLGVTPNWSRILLAFNQEPFGVSDPVFGQDIGFYVFRLPFHQFLYGWMFSGLLVVVLVVAGAHYLTGGIRPQAPGDRVTPQVKAHLSALLGLVILLRGWGYRLDQYQLLYSPRGEVTGASYTDVNAVRPALTLLIFISIIVAGLFLVNIRQRGWVLPLAGLGLWLLISILARGIYPFVIQRFTVEPAQLEREEPYIVRNIEHTRQAYGIDAMEVQEYPAVTGISPEAVEANRDAIGNIRLWDPGTLSRSYRQLQEIRTYYQFDDVDIDRYAIGGGLRQLLLSVRELEPGNLETRTWLNLHVVYTHGYGVVASPTNESDPEGQPAFLLHEIPPIAQAPELELEQPGIYYGEGLADTEYSLVGTRQQELDYGTPEENRFTTYEGKGGVPAASLLRRLAFSWRFRNINVAISRLIEPETKILYYRQIRDRLGLAAPFLHFDGDPYPVIAGGRVVWLADAYTLSPMYPYSERLRFHDRTGRVNVDGLETPPAILGEYNYIRNSVKATVDAYDGTVTLYVWDESDPIIRAWRKIFPDLFRDASQMPDEIRSHVRYPEDLFRIQSYLYRRYHMIKPQDFYTQEDLWIIPRDPGLPETAVTTSPVMQEIQPFYVLMRLPGSEELEYVLILPFNPRGRPNMVSYVVAKSGPEDYGKLIDFRFPRGRQIDGVGQVHARINQNPEISRTITLLSQRGSEVILGNLLVIPIENSILYVQPLFLQADRNAIPELKHVIMATSERVVMGLSIDDAFRLLFEGGPTVSEEVAEERPALEGDLVRQALDHLIAAEEAARRGDWATYGREIEEARRALEEANRQP